MSNPRFARPQHQSRGGMYDFTHKILPFVFFLHFIITGTVVLVYTLYLHEPIPEKYAIGASITFGCVIIPMIAGYITLHESKRYGANRRSDEEMAFSPPQSRSRSRTREGMKEHWSRWRMFCQEYGNHQRKYVREFAGKRKENPALRETTVDGAKRIQSLNNTQIFTFVLEKWTRNLAQSRMKNLEGRSKAQRAPRSTDEASSNNQKQSGSSQAERDAQITAQKRGNHDDLNTSERPRVIPHDFHGRNQKSAPPRRFSFESDFASDQTLNGSETKISIESNRNSTVGHNKNPNERRPSVALEDVLPRHPEPNELYSGFRQRQFPQAHSATTRGRSFTRIQENEGRTAGSRGGRGGSLPVLRRQKQVDDLQASFELQNTCPWTTNDPFSKQYTDFTRPLGTFNNLMAQPREGQMTTLPAIAHLSPESGYTEALELPSNAERAQQVIVTTGTRLRDDSSSNQSSSFSSSGNDQTFRPYKAYSVDAASLTVIPIT